jgi:hypothetical protein
MCGCLLLFVGAAFPRIGLVLLEVFSDYNDRAFSSFWEGFVGFLFLPYATLFYVLMDNWQDGINGFGWFFVVLGFLFDIGSYTDGYRRRHVVVEGRY